MVAPTINIKNLKAFLRKNKKVDFRTADLLHASTLDSYKWTGLEDNKEGLISQLKAYQRLLRIVPNDQYDLAIKLLHAFGNDTALAQACTNVRWRYVKLLRCNIRLVLNRQEPTAV